MVNRMALPKLVKFLMVVVLLPSLFVYSINAKAGNDLPDFSTDNRNVEFVSSQIGGAFGEIFVQNHIAYLGIGKNLVILNINDPRSYFIEGRLRDIPNQVADIFVDQTKAYVTDLHQLWIIDVENLSQPEILGTFKPDAGCGAVAVKGNFAYALCRTTLYAINVTDPAHPTVSGKLDIPDSGFWISSMRIDGNYAYIANGEQGLYIVNISNPASMKIAGVGSGSSYGRVNDVYVTRKNGRQIAYIISPEKGIFSADVTNPANILIYKNLYLLHWPTQLQVQGDYAYIANQYGGLWIVNISNLDNPVVQSTFETDGMAFHVFLDGTTALVNNNYGGLQLVDVRDPSNPAEVSYYEEPVWINRLVVKGDVAYTVGLKGLGIYNVKDPYNLRLLSLYKSQTTGAIELTGNNAYLGIESGKFEIVDVQNSKSPKHIGEFQITSVVSSLPQCSPPPPSLPDPPHVPAIADIFIEDQYAYLANGEAGLRILDISDAGNITEKAVYKHPNWVFINQVHKAGNLAYVLDGGCFGMSGGLWVVDLSDLTQPSVLGWVQLPKWGSDLEVHGNLAYVAASENGFYVIQLEDPQHPQIIGLLEVQQEGVGYMDGYIHGHLAYLASSSGGLHVVDVTDPGSPIIMGSYQLDGAYGVYHQGCVTYLAQWGSGMTLVGYQGNGENCVVSGHVQDPDGNPVSGVQLNINPSQPAPMVTGMSAAGISVTTDQNGNFTLPGLTTNQYDLNPSMEGKVFIPRKRQIKVATDITDQNFIVTEEKNIFLPSIRR